MTCFFSGPTTNISPSCLEAGLPSNKHAPTSIPWHTRLAYWNLITLMMNNKSAPPRNGPCYPRGILPRT